jgi:hypothetical protein
LQHPFSNRAALYYCLNLKSSQNVVRFDTI